MDEQVQYAPVPTQISVGNTQGGTPNLVILRIVTPVGAQMFFISADDADTISAGLLKGAAIARSGLEVPSSGLEIVR